MTFTDRHIVYTYSSFFEGLNPVSKIELIERLSKSLKADSKKRESNFYKSFGGFASSESAEELIKEIKSSRKFRKKEIKF